MDVYREFSFEAAHHLPNVPAEHKCSRLHGHSFRVEVHVRGDISYDSGWVLDFADLESAFTPIHAKLDHQYLNEIEGLSNPTSENLARWIWNELDSSVPMLYKIIVRETCTTGCVYYGEREPKTGAEG